jgi:hypothetical protein
MADGELWTPGSDDEFDWEGAQREGLNLYGKRKRVSGEVPPDVRRGLEMEPINDRLKTAALGVLQRTARERRVSTEDIPAFREQRSKKVR